jgi:uncharacterized protein (TIGR03067 family)
MRAAMGIGTCVLFLTVCALAAEDKDKQGKFDAAKLVGTWKYVSGEKNGEKIDKDRLKDQTVSITKDTITLKGEQTFVIKYELDAKKKPATVKMEITESPFGAGAKAEGILELKGDELKICYTPDGEAPKKFETKEGSKAHLFILKRSK